MKLPGTRARCPALGTYESIRTEAALADPADRGGNLVSTSSPPNARPQVTAHRTPLHAILTP
ncbi:hypothetical protein ADL21_05845 [Streptomyces albus subsp. albus]|nr:hypothetical protein ADL21_05845 [Streptomyces albus subsp. albus]